MSSLDAYTRSHLQDAEIKIQKWMDSQYVINQNDVSAGIPMFRFGN